MIGVADKRGFPHFQADETDDDQVIKWNREHDKWCEQGIPARAQIALIGGREIGGANGQDTEHQADEQAAAIAHEDAGRGKVEHEEAEKCANEQCQHNGHEQLPRLGHG